MRTCGTRSGTVSRVSWVRLGMLVGMSASVALAGMSPKYSVTFCLAVFRSMSPASTSTALLGPYQLLNQVFTSSSVAASRSAMEPMVCQL